MRASSVIGLVALSILGMTGPATALGPAGGGPHATRQSSGVRRAPGGDAAAAADFETLNFRSAVACAPCHGAGGEGKAARGADGPVMFDQWIASIMSNGSTDPFWQAKVRSEVLRAPHLRETIEGKCASCHAPMAATEAALAGEPVLLFDGGFLDAGHELHPPAMESISCTLCHRIENDETLGTGEGFSGHYVIEPVDDPVNRPHYGPYADTFNQPMIVAVGLANRVGAQIGESALCAACHNLDTPFLDAAGNVVGTDFPEQTPFTEWQASSFPLREPVIGCRQCHMPVEDRGRIAHRPNWLPERDRASHAFVSANTEMLQLLAVRTAAAGGDPAPLLAAADAGRAFLGEAGRLTRLDSSLSAGTLEFALAVDNFSGHKLPTAFPSRRVYLHAVVSDPNGAVVFESGAMAPTGRIIGVDSDEDPSTFEPHHQTITSADQVQVWESILGTTDDEVTFTLLRAGRYLKDNRLTPAGFDPSEVPDDVRPVGECTGDPDFGFGRDEIRYRLAGLAAPSYEVRVELRHQSIGYPYVQDLRTFESDPAVASFLALYDAVLPGSELIAELSFQVSD